MARRHGACRPVRSRLRGRTGPGSGKRACSRHAPVRCRSYAYRTDHAFTCTMDCLSRLPPGAHWADIACRTTAELSPSVTKRPSGKTGAWVSPGYSRLALADAQQCNDDVIGDLPTEADLLVLVCGW